MNILYGFSNCSYNKYNELFKDSSVMVLQQAQKYHSLMTRGLKENGLSVECISGLPINRGVMKAIWTKGGNDEENGVKYHYFGSINLPVFRQLILVIKSFLYTLTKENVDLAICDILNISILIGMFFACRLRRIPLIGIVTDVPGKLASNNASIAKRIDAFFMQRMHGYVFLTEWMNQEVNPHHRPYVIIEGQVDSDMASSRNEQNAKDTPKVVMYAGSIKKIYGIKKLTEAFIECNNPEWMLHIYGDGDYRQELIEICKQHPEVVYKGICLNKDIVEAELRASLLVNPRPTNEEYVKYSFPSKNMEYMVSGTPVLTTNLPGMPEEYREHVFVFENETTEGMTNLLRKIMQLPADELHLKGYKAKDFVLKHKNQKSQARKVCDLIDSIIR